ncbi:transcriptional regulator, GntR family [Quadrisphaera granulorum]|uniref:GntR family transcriptional regulator n=1 Tax=Quadrisphaera granulorum TaxID=317664 RepID=A0A316AEH4_9ACTN|nr:PLP-dependent aminotransferase family protein [Quadrisphaera granulorum]PWJ55380.1 GntR family transcriptional regulator [Quadrisphaera granulorum]SZE95444.1 transcriptional regulator, GntR family [Quadrisphaera granulorum]
MRTATDLDLPLALDRTDRSPLQVQLASALRAAVLDHRLPPGGPVPATRRLAEQLGVSRATVTAAYEQLVGEGFLEARHGSGTRVSTHVGALPAAPPVARSAPRQPMAVRAAADLRPGRPDASRLADAAWRSAWRSAVLAAVPDSEPPLAGLPALREQVAAHLRAARGIAADPAGVVVTAGTSDGLALVAHALRAQRHPDGAPLRVVVEDPGYPSAARCLRRVGAQLLPVDVDDDGLLVDQLPASADAVLVTPSHQYPWGGVLPLERRVAMLRWAREAGAVVIEDDYDGEFRYGAAPLPALASLDPSRVVHVGTFSKVLSPWLRAGYLLAPPPLRAELEAVRVDLGVPVGGTLQTAMATYLAGGGLQRQVARARRDAAHRRAHLQALVAEYPHLRARGAAAGLHVVVELPDGADAAAVVAALAADGYLVADLTAYAVARADLPPAVVLGYGPATLDQLRGAVAALARAAAQDG